MNETRELLERIGGRFAFPQDAFDRLERRRDRRRRNQRIAAGAVGIAVFVAAIWIVTSGVPSERTATPGGGGGTGPTGTPEPTMIAPEADGIIGLPVPGAIPSTPKNGELVLYLEGSTGGAPTALWLYDDGRLIWGDVFGNLPEGAPTQGATGFVEQHLTPAGVEFLRSQVVSTGLFEDDLSLLRGPDDPPSLTIRVRNRDRLVWLTWAVEENDRVPKDARTATPEQASALLGVYALLTDPTSWPASVWEDQDVETYVPSRYQVGLGAFPDQGAGPRLPIGAREWALLPAAATDILGRGTKVDEAAYELTTDDTRALAEALNAAGLEPWAMPMGEAALRYSLDHPDEPGYTLWILIGPILPHGEAVFLGPG